MNKMGTISAIRERIIGIITKEVNKTEKEIADFEEKVSDNLYYYGEGGWYKQYTTAKARREKYLGELNELKTSIESKAAITVTIRSYVYECKHCNMEVSLNRNTWDTLNCPVCGGEIHRRGDYEEMRVARGSRIMKKGDSYIQLTENGKVVEK